jgi:hypothetical protein
MFTRDYMSLFVLIYFLQGYFSFMIQVTFGGLKWVDLSFFCFFFIDFFSIYPLILSYFLKGYYGFMIQIMDLTSESKLIRVDLTCCRLNIKKNYLEFFLVKLYFYYLSRLFLNLTNWLSHIISTYTWFNLFFY